MRVVGRDRLHAAVEEGAVPDVLARAWLAEALDARWAGPKDILAHYEGSEFVDTETISVALDAAGHCVVFFIEFRIGLIVIQFAGQKREYSMGKRRSGARS
jgi:mRNA-degrading endonuclease HigB of HigAB toxin-antitoxin module